MTYWHFFDSVRNLAAILVMPLALYVFSSWNIWEIALFCVLCFWLPVFTLVYKVWLLKEWTFKQWIVNAIQIWK
jgi:hypothetical protein